MASGRYEGESMNAHWYYVGVQPCGCWTMAMVDMTEDPARWNMTAAQAAKEMGEEIAMFEKESPDCAIEHVHVDRMEVGKQLAAPWPDSCPHKAKQLALEMT